MLDRTPLYNLYFNWWRNLDKVILFLFTILFFLGLFFSLVSTSLIASDKLNTNSYYFFLKHLMFVAFGFITIIAISLFKSSKIIRFSIIFFIITLLTLILVPLLGTEVKGSKRWIDFGFLPRFQPVELLKPFLIIMLSLVLCNLKNLSIIFKYFLTFILLLPIILLLIGQPDIGQTILIFLTWLSLIFVSGINLIIFFSFFIISGFILTYLILFVEKFAYIKIRLLAFLNPTNGNNYQSEKASEAIINGGFFGKGIGEGKLNSRIPEAHNDYIVSVISEEFGIIIVILIMLLYLILALRVLKKISEIKNNLSKLILVGCISIILIQAFIHIGVNIRMIPTTGMTLPFLSYGGSSIIGTSLLCGLILNFTKREISI
jgi:cell division protein FtsW